MSRCDARAFVSLIVEFVMPFTSDAATRKAFADLHPA